MSGKFVPATGVQRQVLDWGTLGWLSHPPATGANHLTVIDVVLQPGCGHNFHKHPDQEEVIFVVEGRVEQWLDKQKQLLREFAGTEDANVLPQRRSFLEKLKRAFTGSGEDK